MESTATQRVWHKGAPPFQGWWNASRARDYTAWRWWNGEQWSAAAYEETDTRKFGYITNRRANAQKLVEWTDYWPENARVPRIDPAVGYLDIGDARWYLFEGQPMKGRVPRIVDSSAWKRWAEQRNAMPDPLGLAMRAEPPPPLPRGFQGMAHLYAPAKIGRTRMVDGNELAQLAMDAERLAERLRKLSNTAS